MRAERLAGSTSDCFVFSTYTLDPATLGYCQLFSCASISGADPAGARAALRVDAKTLLSAERPAPRAWRISTSAHAERASE
jgi:hypothetical protein